MCVREGVLEGEVGVALLLMRELLPEVVEVGCSVVETWVVLSELFSVVELCTEVLEVGLFVGEVGDEGVSLDEVDCSVVVCESLVVAELVVAELVVGELAVGELGFDEGLVGMTAELVLVCPVEVGDLGVVVCRGLEVEADTSAQTKSRFCTSFDLPSNCCATSEQTWTGTRVEEPAEFVFQSPIQVTGAPASSVVVMKGSVLPLTTVAFYIAGLVSYLHRLLGKWMRTYFGTNVAEAPGVVAVE